LSHHSLPQPLPDLPDPPTARDEPYGSVLHLHVDATDVVRGIFRVRQTMSVGGAGEIVLLYPRWLPGFHSPQAPIELLAGLRIRAAGRELVWRRHPVKVNAFHFDVPEVSSIEIEFQFLSPTDAAQGRVICTREMFCMPWSSVVLYPAGHFARQIMLDPRLTLPDDWQLACALTHDREPDGTIRFERTSLDVLVDSPVLAGRHFRREDLDDQVSLTMVADMPHLLTANAEQIAVHRSVVEQADRLFRSRPFDRFEMLLALSDSLSAEGIEHHRSFEAVSVPGYFTQWDANVTRRDTIPHEYVHSWNGKHRRGADSWTPDFEQPIRNSLMWVYEGQTQYWTTVLCARSGMWTAKQALGALALTSARYDVRPGSRWRPMIDTTRDPVIAARSPLPWTSWQRSEDYYSEGALIWLDVDTRIRELSDDARSLDDFARIFFGDVKGGWATCTYEFADVVEALETVASFDWAEFFREQLHETHERAPLVGLERGGYRLVYRDEASGYQRAYDAELGQVDLTHSLGLTTTSAGRITDVLWESAAFEAGLTVGSTIVGIGDRRFSPDEIVQAVREAAAEPITLAIGQGSGLHRVTVKAPNGLRYPHLERIPDRPPRLDDIFSPRLD